MKACVSSAAILSRQITKGVLYKKTLGLSISFNFLLKRSLLLDLYYVILHDMAKLVFTVIESIPCLSKVFVADFPSICMLG